jgi:alcohol dehydrogenase class IV
MWYFNSPEIIYGEDALSYLDELPGRKAFVITDPVLHGLGFTETVAGHLRTAGLDVGYFAEVEPEPSLATVQRAAEAVRAVEPDWIVGLGGGSALDVAKAAWILYERPDLTPDSISPALQLGPLPKARLLNIPTTAGTGAEVTIGAVLTDTEEGRKLEVASRSMMARLVIVDPILTARLPARLAADSGIDVLTHAVDGYLSTWHNDFSDGLCLKAAQMVFEHLPNAVSGDSEARAKMAVAATIAGLGMGNSHIALTHALGHALGAVFKQAHGRCVGLCLPYYVEYEGNGGRARCRDVARFLSLAGEDEASAGLSLGVAIRGLLKSLGQPDSIKAMGISAEEFEEKLPRLCELAMSDTAIVTTARCPDEAEMKKLFRHAYAGRPIDF